MANQTLSESVKDVLKRSTVTGNQLALPPGQLDRKLYDDVNAVLVNLGGKWNRGTKAHIFKCDVKQKLDEVLGTGVSIDTKKLYQAFFTPPNLADELAVLANVRDQVVLEPSAGEGAIADACMRAGAHSVECVELNPECVEVLKSKGFNAITHDFLKFEKMGNGFNCIVMNPPFHSGLDIKHVFHALNFLSSGGRLVSVMWLNTERSKFKKLIDGLDYQIKEIPAGTFKESGTNVGAIILIVNK